VPKETEKEPRRRLSPDERRNELLDAAYAVLREKGVRETRVEDITRAANASKGTFYLYFASWDDMLLALRERMLTVYVQQMDTLFFRKVGADWLVLLKAECVRFIDFIHGLGELHAVLFHSDIADQPIDPALSAHGVIAQGLRVGMKAGECRPVDPEVASGLLFAALHATADSILLTGERERYLDGLFDLLDVWLRPVG